MNFNVDIAIFIGFLALNLIVGLRHSKQIKTIKDYALGGRNFSTSALVATITATWISGSGFFTTLSKTYSDGLYYTIASSGMAISFIITAIYFVPRMGYFLGKTSVAEAMGDLYGAPVRIITAITGAIGASGSIAVQFKVFGSIFVHFLGFPSNIAIMISGVIVTVYSAFGGIRAVTYTDILQFFTFGFVIPLIGVILWSGAYESGFDLEQAFRVPKFYYKEVFSFDNPQFWAMIPLFLYFVNPSMSPALCQRVMMGSNLAQVKKAFIVSGVLIFIIKLLTAWIPFLLFHINPNLEPSQLLMYIVDTYAYTGLKGLIIISIIAMAMSTADSNINSSSVLFANDICYPLKINSQKALILSKFFSMILGGFAVVLALSSKDLLDIILSANSFYYPVAAVPLMFTILGFRTTTKSVLIGMAAGFITISIWNMSNIKMDGIVFAMCVNALFMFGTHYLLKQQGGWGFSAIDKNS